MARKATPTGTIYGYGKTPKEAEDDLDAKLNPIPLTGKSSPVHEVAKALWYSGLDSVKPQTKKRYVGSYLKYVRPAVGNVPISEFAMRHAQAVLDLGKKHKQSPNSLKMIKSVLKQIIDAAIIEGYLTMNPCSYLKLPRMPEKRVRILTVQTAQELLANAADTQLSAPVFLAAVLGLRRGEVLGLKWNDLDRQRGELRIVRQRQTAGGKTQDAELKTRGSRRTLRLTPGLINEIDSRGDLDCEYVCSYAGQPWHPDTLSETWAKNRAGWGLADWRFHDLRHGAAGLLYAAGCDMLQIAAVLGHSKPDMSLLYTDATAERLGEGVLALSNSLGFM